MHVIEVTATSGISTSTSLRTLNNTKFRKGCPVLTDPWSYVSWQLYGFILHVQTSNILCHGTFREAALFWSREEDTFGQRCPVILQSVARPVKSCSFYGSHMFQHERRTLSNSLTSVLNMILRCMQTDTVLHAARPSGQILTQLDLQTPISFH